MGRKRKETKVCIHIPETEEALYELSGRAATVHADMVISYIKKLSCTTDQKLKLFDALIKSAQSG